MRVTHLISSTGFYGAERVVAELSTQLAAMGCEVTVVHFDRATSGAWQFSDKPKNVTVSDLCWKAPLDVSGFLRLVKHLRLSGTEVLHTHGYKADIFGLLAARLAGCKVVATCHNWTSRTHLLRGYAALDRWALRRFDRVATVSEIGAEQLTRGGMRQDRLQVISNGIAMGPEPAGATADESAEPVVVCVARLSVEKGVDVLIRSLPEISAAFPRVKCIVAGEGVERDCLTTLAASLQVADRLLLAGYCADTRSMLLHCSVYVQPSRTEGLPMAVLEAMAAQRAVVASAVGGMPALLEEGKLGSLVPPDDPKALARAVVVLLRDGNKRRQLGESASQAVRAKFGSAKMAIAYQAMYLATCGLGTQSGLAQNEVGTPAAGAHV